MSLERDLGEDGEGSDDLKRDILDLELRSMWDEVALAPLLVSLRWPLLFEWKWLEKFNMVRKTVVVVRRNYTPSAAGRVQEQWKDVHLCLKDRSCANNSGNGTPGTPAVYSGGISRDVMAAQSGCGNCAFATFSRGFVSE